MASNTSELWPWERSAPSAQWQISPQEQADRDQIRKRMLEDELMQEQQRAAAGDANAQVQVQRLQREIANDVRQGLYQRVAATPSAPTAQSSDQEPWPWERSIAPASPYDLPTPSLAPARPATRNPAAVLNDWAIEIANQVLGTGKAITDFVVPGTELAKRVEDLIRQGEESQSDVTKEAKRKLQESMSAGGLEAVQGVGEYAVTSPGLAASMLLGQLGPAKVAITGTANLAGRALRLGEAARTSVGLGAGSVYGAAAGGGDAAGDAYDMTFRGLVAQGMSEEEADRYATVAAREASVAPAVLGAVGGRYGVERVFAGGGRGGLLRTGLAEGLQQGIEEGATKASANIAAGQYVPGIDPMQGVVGSAALGGLLGFGGGALVGYGSQRPTDLLARSTPSATQGELFPQETAGPASVLGQQFTDLSGLREALRTDLARGGLDPMALRETREDIERIDRILGGYQPDQMPLEFDQFRYQPSLQGRKERAFTGRNAFQRDLLAPEVAPDAPKDLLMPGQYTPTEDQIALPQRNTQEAYALAVERVKRGEPLSKLDEYLLSNPPETETQARQALSGLGPMQQLALQGPRAAIPLAVIEATRARAQEPYQRELFDIQARTQQPGPTLPQVPTPSLVNRQQPGQTEMFFPNGQPTYGAAALDYRSLAAARLQAEGARPTEKRISVATKAEQALAEGRIDEGTYDQIYTLLRESKYARANKLTVGASSVTQTTQAQQTEAQGQEAPAAAAAQPVVETAAVAPQLTEAPNAIQVESTTEVPVQPRAEAGTRVGEEVRSAQEPTGESQQAQAGQVRQTEEKVGAPEGSVTTAEATKRLMQEGGLTRAEASEYVKSVAEDGAVRTSDIDAVIKSPGVFSTGVKPGKGSSKAAVRSWIDPIISNWRAASNVQVVQSVSELPDGVDAPADAKGLLYDGKIYIVADNASNQFDATVTLFHEVVGHYGFRALFRPNSSEYIRMMAQLETQNDTVRANAAAWRANNQNQIQNLKAKFGYTDTMVRALSVEEAVADMAHEALRNENVKNVLAKSPAIRTFAKWVAKALNALGMRGLATKVRGLTDNLDVFALMSTSRNAAQFNEPPAWLKGPEEKSTPKPTTVTTAEQIPVFSTGGPIQPSLMPAAAQDYGSALIDTAFSKARRGILGLRFLRNIKSTFGDKLDGVNGYIEKAFAMGARTNERLKASGQIANEWGSLDKEAETVSRLADLGSYYEFFADVPMDKNEHTSNGRKVSNSHLFGEEGTVADDVQEAYKEAAEIFKNLSAKAKKTYLDARDQLHKDWIERQALFNKNIDAVYKPLIDTAQKAGNKDKVAALQKERNTYIKQFGQVLAQRKGAYFPFTRPGDYYVSRKSDEYRAAETELNEANEALAALYSKYDIPMSLKKEIAAAEKSLIKLGEDPALLGLSQKTKQEFVEARKRVREAQKNVETLTKQGEKHFVNESYESETQARLRAKELGTSVRLQEDQLRELNPINRGFIEKLSESVGAALPADQALKAREAIVQIYLATLPSTSAAKRQIRRKGVAGYNKDMLRAFSIAAQKDAHYLARLEYMDDMTAELMKVKRAKDRAANADMDALYKELARRHAASLKYHQSPVEDGLASIAFVYQLGVSPAFLLTSMAQPWMISLPFMSARHGLLRSKGALGAAFADTVKAAVSSVREQGLFFEIKLDKFPENERKMLEDAMRDGLLDITLETDLGGYAKGGTSKLSKFTKAMGVMPHQVEVVNRVMTALAAYRMEIDKGRTQDEATVYAKRVLDKTHFDYSSTNAPYYLKPGVVPLGKLLFQYRKYQLGMLTLLGETIKTSLKGASAKERSEARRALLGIFGTQALMTGATGLPAVGTIFFIAKLLGAIFGDDDEPNDPEADFRQMLAEAFGVETGAVVAKGIPAMMGVDLSRVLGAGDITAPVRVLRQDKEGRDLYAEFILAGLGPTIGGLGPQFAEGLKAFGNGDFYRGTEGMLPRALRDVIRAARLADKGLTTKGGQEIFSPEEVNNMDIALQALGVPSMFLTERQAAVGAVEGARTAVKGAKSRLLLDYVEARRSGDADAMQSVRERINEFNQRRIEEGEPVIKYKDMLAAYKQRSQYSKLVNKQGVSLAKADQAYAKYGEFADVLDEDEEE